jgi:ubiquinone/menaquinone biosynthesis C-methylase UbiE
MMELTAKEKAGRIWDMSPAGSALGGKAEPGTQEFFENVLHRRSTYEIPWIFEIIPLDSFSQKKLLELGCGAGYDAYAICRAGADYVGIDIASKNPQRTKDHLCFYGYSPKVMRGDVEYLSFKNESFDILFSNGVLHHTPNLEKSLREAYRVLNRDGEFWVIVYHKHSIFYWITLFLVGHILRLGFLKKSFHERLSMIEYTVSHELPIVNIYSRWQFKRILRRVGFHIEQVWIRKLVREDLPVIGPLSKLWQVIPQRWLDCVGRRFGWYIIAHARRV